MRFHERINCILIQQFQFDCASTFSWIILSSLADSPISFNPILQLNQKSCLFITSTLRLAMSLIDEIVVIPFMHLSYLNHFYVATPQSNNQESSGQCSSRKRIGGMDRIPNLPRSRRKGQRRIGWVSTETRISTSNEQIVVLITLPFDRKAVREDCFFRFNARFRSSSPSFKLWKTWSCRFSSLRTPSSTRTRFREAGSSSWIRSFGVCS